MEGRHGGCVDFRGGTGCCGRGGRGRVGAVDIASGEGAVALNVECSVLHATGFVEAGVHYPSLLAEVGALQSVLEVAIQAEATNNVICLGGVAALRRGL